MNKKNSPRAFLIFMVMVSGLLLFSEGSVDRSSIRRLTFSQNNRVLLSSLSANGLYALYTLEILSDADPKKSVRLIEVNSGRETEIFTERETKISNPGQPAEYLVGSKPPLLSGDGSRAFFLLSLGKPDHIVDHVLAIANPSTGEIEIRSFPNQALKGKDTVAKDFQSPDWERISGFAVSHDGTRIACALKGHLGPRRYGNCSGIVLVDLKNMSQRTILGPEFSGTGWVWSSFPRNPLLGGGWAFAMSGNGEKVLFGAQSSEELTDYDLYVADWNSGRVEKITDFSDRWFSLADMDYDGKQVVFYYNGQQKQGIGTYWLGLDDSGIRVLKSTILPRIDLVAAAGDGSLIAYKNIYQGMALDISTGKEFILFDDRVPGYVKGIVPMDFPQVPAFCTPKIVSMKGDRMLLAGPPLGRQAFELYVLSVDLSGINR